MFRPERWIAKSPTDEERVKKERSLLMTVSIPLVLYAVLLTWFTSLAWVVAAALGSIWQLLRCTNTSLNSSDALMLILRMLVGLGRLGRSGSRFILTFVLLSKGESIS